jgi:hypothetical protein
VTQLSSDSPPWPSRLEVDIFKEQDIIIKDEFIRGVLIRHTETNVACKMRFHTKDNKCGLVLKETAVKTKGI